MTEIVKTFVTSVERQLLWTLVQYDTANSIHEVLTATGTTNIEKTQKIINQMDFIFEIRAALLAMPFQGGKISLSTLGRAYMSTLLDTVRHELLSPEIRATFARDRDSLQLKLGDVREAFLLPAPAAKKSS